MPKEIAQEAPDKLDKVIDKLPSGDKLMDTLTNVVDAISQKVVAVAPKAWEVLLAIKRVESLGTVMFAICLIIPSFFFIRWTCKNMSAWVKKVDNEDRGEYIPLVLICGACSCILAIISAIQFYSILDIWVWVGITSPDLAIAHDVYLKAIGR